jgi:hypothetical protein
VDRKGEAKIHFKVKVKRNYRQSRIKRNCRQSRIKRNCRQSRITRNCRQSRIKRNCRQSRTKKTTGYESTHVHGYLVCCGIFIIQLSF